MFCHVKISPCTGLVVFEFNFPYILEIYPQNNPNSKGSWSSAPVANVLLLKVIVICGLIGWYASCKWKLLSRPGISAVSLLSSSASQARGIHRRRHCNWLGFTRLMCPYLCTSTSLHDYFSLPSDLSWKKTQTYSRSWSRERTVIGHLEHNYV